MTIQIPAISLAFLLWSVGGLAVILFVFLAYRFTYRRGYKFGYEVGKKEGQEIARLKGAYCDVCQKVAEKFVMLKMHVVCESCEAAITSNKEMKCKFCHNPVDQCSCT